jgi:hypothetical protein
MNYCFHSLNQNANSTSSTSNSSSLSSSKYSRKNASCSSSSGISTKVTHFLVDDSISYNIYGIVRSLPIYSRPQLPVHTNRKSLARQPPLQQQQSKYPNKKRSKKNSQHKRSNKKSSNSRSESPSNSLTSGFITQTQTPSNTNTPATTTTTTKTTTYTQDSIISPSSSSLSSSSEHKRHCKKSCPFMMPRSIFDNNSFSSSNESINDILNDECILLPRQDRIKFQTELLCNPKPQDWNANRNYVKYEANLPSLPPTAHLTPLPVIHNKIVSIKSNQTTPFQHIIFNSFNSNPLNQNIKSQFVRKRDFGIGGLKYVQNAINPSSYDGTGIASNCGGGMLNSNQINLLNKNLSVIAEEEDLQILMNSMSKNSLHNQKDEAESQLNHYKSSLISNSLGSSSSISSIDLSDSIFAETTNSFLNEKKQGEEVEPDEEENCIIYI